MTYRITGPAFRDIDEILDYRRPKRADCPDRLWAIRESLQADC
jgi:hypothetical protein